VAFAAPSPKTIQKDQSFFSAYFLQFLYFLASNTRAKAEGEMLLRMMSRAFMQMGFLNDPVPLKAISGCGEGIFKY
jgi:hypothetical protein